MISIVTPCYNADAYIAETINSVLAQTYKDWEMIIVDDCSTDQSSTIIHEFTKIDHRIKYFKTSEPSGSPTKPRNIGIQNSKGRYIAFLDSDDLWLPEKLEEQMKLFDKYEDTAIVFSFYEKISETGVRENRVVKAPLCVTYKSLLHGNVIGNLTGIYDSAKVGKCYFLSAGHEDYILWLSILKKGYLARACPSVLALYRVRDNSVSANKLKAMYWTWQIYLDIEQLGYLKSLYYFLSYAFKSFMKSLR